MPNHWIYFCEAFCFAPVFLPVRRQDLGKRMLGIEYLLIRSQLISYYFNI